MVNMYDAGKAFDLRFSQRMFLPGRSLMNPRSSMGTIFGGRPVVQNITVQTTPGGFWGGLMGLGSGFMMGSMFMSGLRGLFGGLFGGGGFGMGGFGMGGLGMGGGCFGTGMPYPAMGGLTGTMPQTITGAGQTQPQTTAQKLANLKTLYPGYNIVAEDDGTFSATKTDKDGNIAEIGTKLSYEDMLDALKANNKTEPQGKPKPETTTAKPDDNLDGTNGPKPNDKVDGNGTVDGNANPNGTNSASPKDKVDGNGTVDGNANTNGTNSANANRQPSGVAGGSGRTGVKVPSGWYRAAADNSDTVKLINPVRIEQDAKENKFSPAKEYVKNHVLKAKYPIYEFNNAQIDKVTAAIIKYNPSVFNADGSFIKDANGSIALGKLDIPSMAWLEANGCGHTNAKIVSPREQMEAEQSKRAAYKETSRPGVYCDPKTGRYYSYRASDGEWLHLGGVKVVNADGTWEDLDGNKYSKRVPVR